MEFLNLSEIKRHPNINNFTIQRHSGGGWHVIISIKVDDQIFKLGVKAQREHQRNFKTLDNAISFVAQCGKTDRATVVFK